MAADVAMTVEDGVAWLTLRRPETSNAVETVFMEAAIDALALAGAPLHLPTFEAGATRYRRLTLVIAAGRIEHVFYPVFPPDGHAAEVLTWLQKHA